MHLSWKYADYSAELSTIADCTPDGDGGRERKI